MNLLERMRKGLHGLVGTHAGLVDVSTGDLAVWPEPVVLDMSAASKGYEPRCINRNSSSGHRCVLQAGHDGDHRTSRASRRHWA